MIYIYTQNYYIQFEMFELNSWFVEISAMQLSDTDCDGLLVIYTFADLYSYWYLLKMIVIWQ